MAADSPKARENTRFRTRSVEESETLEERAMTNYEKKRQARIKENSARLEALGLTKIASSFKNLLPQQTKGGKPKGKAKAVDDDEEYRPTEEDGCSSLSGEEGGHSDEPDDDDEDFVAAERSASRAAKTSKVRKKSGKSDKDVAETSIPDDDYALQQAISLSLENSGEDLNGGRLPGNSTKESKDPIKRPRKRKNAGNNHVKMTEDDIVLHFFQFDESGKGNVTLRDIQRVATAHDFLWTEKEIAEMIYCFDSDGDGKLNLDDFRKILERCNLVR